MYNGLGIQRTQIIENSEKAVRIITLSGYSSHSEPLFKHLNMLKIADQLRLQESKFYFKYIHKNLLAYLLDWEFISNVNIHLHDTRTSSKIHTVRTKHEFAKKSLKYNLPHSVNATPAIVVEKIQTHTIYYICKTIPHTKNIQVSVQYKIVIRVINIIISYFLVNGWKPYFLVHSLFLIFFVIFA